MTSTNDTGIAITVNLSFRISPQELERSGMDTYHAVADLEMYLYRAIRTDEHFSGTGMFRNFDYQHSYVSIPEYSTRTPQHLRNLIQSINISYENLREHWRYSSARHDNNLPLLKRQTAMEMLYRNNFFETILAESSKQILEHIRNEEEDGIDFSNQNYV